MGGQLGRIDQYHHFVKAGDSHFVAMQGNPHWLRKMAGKLNQLIVVFCGEKDNLSRLVGAQCNRATKLP